MTAVIQGMTYYGDSSLAFSRLSLNSGIEVWTVLHLANHRIVASQPLTPKRKRSGEQSPELELPSQSKALVCLGQEESPELDTNPLQGDSSILHSASPIIFFKYLRTIGTE